MLKPSISQPWRIAAAAAAVLLMLLLSVAWRFAVGPVDVDWLKPGLEQGLAGKVDGGRAHIGRAALVWFPDETSFGLRLEDVRLDDGAKRPVIRARKLETGLALDGLTGFAVATGRIAADHFFAAVSVSPQGRWALGYDAKGAPAAGGRPTALDRVILELTGKPRFGRPLSYLRTVDLEAGRLTLRQVGGGPDWTADIRRLAFHRTRTSLTAEADAQVNDSAHPAAFKASAHAAVGLSDAFASAAFSNLIPARIFPSVGATAPLSGLDAVVSGHGSLAYDFRTGVRAAEAVAEAGQGSLKMMRGADQAFQSAHVALGYAPKTGEVVLSTFKVEAERTRLDLNGRFRLVPEDLAKKRPARLEYLIAGPRFVWRLAADAPPQDLFDVLARGRLIPQRKRLEIDEARATIAGAPVEAHGALFRDKHDQLGSDLEAHVSGVVGPDPIFAFWPQGFAAGVRGYLHRAILGGRFINATFRLNAKAGHMRSEGLDNNELRLEFGLEDAAFRFADSFPPITDGRGRALLQGDRFDLTVDAAKIGTVALSRGDIEMPTFRVHGADAIYRFTGRGGVRDILDVLDGPKLHLISGAGFDRGRTSGQGAVDVEIRRPMLFDVPKKDMHVRYRGVIENGGLTNAALGWDLQKAALQLDGDENRFTLKGKGEAGPYKGALDFLCDFGGESHAQLLNLDGGIDASILGGVDGRQSPFAGRFTLKGGGGEGTVHAAVFNGRAAWKEGDGPDRFVLDGWGDGGGLRRAGAPFTAGLPDRFPTQLRFFRNGEVWRGPLKADALSGLVTFTAAQKPRLIYEADLTPLKARRLGLADIPAFTAARKLRVDATWNGPDGLADVRTGALGFQLGWGHGEHRLRGAFTGADFTALGLPPLFGSGAVPVTAVWRSAGGGLVGNGEAGGSAFRFQTAPARGGGQVLTASTDLDRNDLRGFDIPASLKFDGSAGAVVRMALSDRGPPTGRIELDLARADLSLDRTDWKKPAGRPGRAVIDFAKDASGAIRLTRISAQSDALDLEGSATVDGGKFSSADFSRARFAGLIDAAVKIRRDAPSGDLELVVRGRSLDARRWFDRASEPEPAAGGGKTASAGGRAPDASPVKVDAAIDTVRLTRDTTLRDVRLNGVWGSPAQTRMDVSAETVNGGKAKGRLFPKDGYTAVSAETTDAGEVAKGLFGIKDLKGGHAIIAGRLVDGGADLNVDVRDVRVVKAPAMAQLLTVASFKGLADTLNGDGVLFNHVVAPVQIRGPKLVLGEARATGSALGITAEGTADLDAGKLDVHGTLAPAYALNSAMGSVPVLGQILTSRKGEGVFGLGYSAKGSFEKPQVLVNPLSLVTPGILRRMFEAQGPQEQSKPKPAGGAAAGGGSGAH